MTQTGNRIFKKVQYRGITFDSKLEFERYLYLQDQQKLGMIRDLRVHTKHRLELDGNPLLIRSDRYPNGRASSWTDDFSYEVAQEDGSWKRILEDVKGRDTYDERLKRGIVELLTGHRIKVVKAASVSRLSG